MIIDVKKYNKSVRIYVDSVLHIFFKRNKLIGIQSWIEEDGWFKIEFYFKNKNFICEYDNRKIWEGILKELDKIIL